MNKQNSFWKDSTKEQPQKLRRVITWNPITDDTEIINNCVSVNDGYFWVYWDDVVKNIKLL